MLEEFQDKRGRKWKCFCDTSYYDMICVRCEQDKEFNSELSFHFETYHQAKQFSELLKTAR